MGRLLDQAWETFDRAARFEEKAQKPDVSESMKRMALKAANKHLDDACALEEAGLAAGERHS